MQALRSTLLACSLGLALLGPVTVPAPARAAAPAAGAVDTRAPDVLVKEISAQALAALRANPSVKSGDIARINRLIDELITPYADFSRTTAITVGRYWRDATPEQKIQLEREFRDLLILIYSGGLRNFGDQAVQYRPFRPGPDEDEAVVRTFVLNRGEPVQVDYRMHKNPNGWKIYDVNVAGLWLTEAYRTQFAAVLQQGGIPNLLKTLADKNSALEKSRAAQGKAGGAS